MTASYSCVPGYLELRDQARLDPFLRESLGDILGIYVPESLLPSSVAFTELTQENNPLDPNQCNSTSQATKEFMSFVDALRRRAPLGDGAWHSFPQAVKIDHVDPSWRGRRFNALGKVEHLLDDTNAIR